VQIVSKVRGVVTEVEHIGSAHTDAELALLLTAARERLHPGQGELDLGPLARGRGQYRGCRGLDASVSRGVPARLDEPWCGGR
jgi:hypothetical protein